jgi:YkoP domain
LRVLIRSFDAFLRWLLGIVPLSGDPACLLRVRVTHAAQAASLPGGLVPAGAEVLELHLWNERVPPMPYSGPDLAWARRTQRMFLGSLREAARQLGENPGMAEVQAVTGTTVLIFGADGVVRSKLMQGLGFSVFPVRSPLGRFGEFWENSYTRALMWAYNPPSVKNLRVFGMRRDEFWMTRGEFLDRFGR